MCEEHRKNEYKTNLFSLGKTITGMLDEVKYLQFKNAIIYSDKVHLNSSTFVNNTLHKAFMYNVL